MQQTEQGFVQSQATVNSVCVNQCPVDAEPDAPADAIVLLGWGATQPGVPYRPQVQLTDTGNRILYAADLYRQQFNRTGGRPFVIVSAGRRAGLQGSDDQVIEARDIRNILVNAGVRPEDIILEERGIDIRTSVEQVRNRLADLRKNGQIGDRPRIILVTSALNANRATLSFAREGIQVVPRSTNFYTIQSAAQPKRVLQVSDFVPSADALLLTTRVIQEYLLSIYYFLRGWLSPFR